MRLPRPSRRTPRVLSRRPCSSRRGVALGLEGARERRGGSVVAHSGIGQVVVEHREVPCAIRCAAAVVSARAVVGGELDRRSRMDQLEVEIGGQRVHDPDGYIHVEHLRVRETRQRGDVQRVLERMREIPVQDFTVWWDDGIRALNNGWRGRDGARHCERRNGCACDEEPDERSPHATPSIGSSDPDP